MTYFPYISNPQRIPGVILSRDAGLINFYQLSKTRIKYVLLNLGTGLEEDLTLKTYLRETRQYQIKVVGFYFKSRAASVEDAIQEAKMAKKVIKNIVGNTYRVNKMIVFAWTAETMEALEAEGKMVSKPYIGHIAEAFTNEIEKGDYRVFLAIEHSWMGKVSEMNPYRTHRKWNVSTLDAQVHSKSIDYLEFGKGPMNGIEKDVPYFVKRRKKKTEELSLTDPKGKKLTTEASISDESLLEPCQE